MKETGKQPLEKLVKTEMALFFKEWELLERCNAVGNIEIDEETLRELLEDAFYLGWEARHG